MYFSFLVIIFFSTCALNADEKSIFLPELLNEEQLFIEEQLEEIVDGEEEFLIDQVDEQDCIVDQDDEQDCITDLSDEQKDLADEGEELLKKTKEIAAVDNLGPTAAGFVAEKNFGPDDDDVFDQRVLRDFIESRGLIQCRQKEGLLTIAGDIRARWVTAGENVNGHKVRGTGALVGLNQYKSEVNLFFDYETKKAWASTKLRWSMFGGKDGGTAAKPDVDRAFIGYDIYSLKKTDFYIEVGRSRLDYLFESKVEFTASFTGMHLYYTKCIEKLGSFVIHGGPFVTDAFTNHYSWVLEGNVKELGGTPFSVKYSIIDWRRRAPTIYFGNLKKADLDKLGIKTISHNPRYEFLVSQMILGYQREIDFIRCKTLYAYAAVLVNHAAKKRFSTDFRYLNHAWYTGFTLGKLCKACDWSIDLNYQWVQAQSVPEFDLSGMGHGNAEDLLISDAIILGLSPSLVRGFTNYKGVQLSLLFAMTDSLSLRAIAQYATPIDTVLGGSFRFKGFDLSVIYAF